MSRDFSISTGSTLYALPNRIGFGVPASSASPSRPPAPVKRPHIGRVSASSGSARRMRSDIPSDVIEVIFATNTRVQADGNDSCAVIVALLPSIPKSSYS